MKKIISVLSAFLLSSLVFAYSDFSFKLAPTMCQETYVLDGQAYGQASATWSIGIVNYNFFDEKNHFGCFEEISYNISSASTTNVALGFAAGVDANDFIRFQGGLGLHLSYGVSSSSQYISSASSYETKTESNLKLGLVTDFGLKLTPYKLFSPVIGFSLRYDPICSSIVNTNGAASVKAYSSYSNFGINPYINFCINLK